MADWKYTVVWLAAVSLGLAVSNKTTWKESMEVCAKSNERPSTKGDAVQNNTWLGKAKYELPWGVITLQIQRVEENETCSDCGSLEKRCQFCTSPAQLNQSVSSLEVLKTKIIPGQKYILRDSWPRIAVPTRCLVYRGASHTEYVSCFNHFHDGCRASDDVSSFNVTIYLAENEGEMQDCLWRFLLEKYKSYLPVLGGVLALLIIFDTTCIYCCVKRRVNRQLRTITKNNFNEIKDRPISEAITCIYKTKDNEKETEYDLVSNVNGVSNLNAANEKCSSIGNDEQLCRPMSHNSDYDNVWPNAWTTLVSPEAKYTQAKKVGKTLMTVNPDEEIYSKQKLEFMETIVAVDELLTDGIQKSDETKNTLSSNINENIPVHEIKTKIMVETDQKCQEGKSLHMNNVDEDKNMDKTGDYSCKKNNFQRSQMTISVGVCRKDEKASSETDQTCLESARANMNKEDIESEERNNDKTDDSKSNRANFPLTHMTPAEACRKNEKPPSLTKDKTENDDRDASSKERVEFKEETSVTKSQKNYEKVRKLKLDGKMKTRDSSPDENLDIRNISKEEAEQLVDEATAILMANMNNVFLKTKR